MKNGKCNKMLCVLCVYIIIVVGLLTSISSITMIEGVNFIIYLVFGVVVQGMALLQIMKVPYVDELEWTVFGYGIGYSMQIILYFIISILDIKEYGTVINIVLSIIGMIVIIKSNNERNIPKTDNKTLLILFVLISGTLIIRFFTYFGLNILPSPRQDVFFGTQDILFYIGNAISAGNGFPLEEFRFAGKEFKYHYFGSIQLEMAAMYTNIHELKLEMCLLWIQIPILLVTSFWCLLRRMQIKKWLCIFGEFLLLFSSGFERIVYIAFQEKMYCSPFGYDVGLAFCILTIIGMLMQEKEIKINFSISLFTVISFAICMGAKAPAALIVLFFCGIMCAKWLFVDKKYVCAFMYGLLLLGIFFLLFFGIVSDGMNTVNVNSTGLRFSLTGHLYECGLGNMYFDLVEHGLPKILGKVYIFIFYFVGANPIVYSLFYYAGIKQYKSMLRFEGVLFITVLMGMIMTLFSKQQGNSQMYFAMTTMPFAIAYSMKWLSERKLQKKKYELTLRVSACALCIISFVCFYDTVSLYVIRGYQKMFHSDAYQTTNNSLAWGEWQAYLWIDQNTEKDALFVCNTITHDEQFESFIVGVCTRRKMWMEGWRYVAGYVDASEIEERRDCITKLYQGDMEARERAIESDVKYAIYINAYGREEQEPVILGRVVFVNEYITLYELSRE